VDEMQRGEVELWRFVFLLLLAVRLLDVVQVLLPLPRFLVDSDQGSQLTVNLYSTQLGRTTQPKKITQGQ
jgi:hypothetical protein